MQKGFKKGFLKLLKNHENLQESALKVSRDNLNDFESDLDSLRGTLKSFKDVSEGKIEFKNFNEDFNKD